LEDRYNDILAKVGYFRWFPYLI